VASKWDVDVGWIEPWLMTLDDDSYEQVIAALELLRERGPHLGRPVADSISGSRHHNMKELRPGSSGRSELRLLFAFDPTRRAVVLVAGDKSGNWKQWYSKNIPVADARFDSHLEALRRSDGKDS
jgi:hypothetical protein